MCSISNSQGMLLMFKLIIKQNDMLCDYSSICLSYFSSICIYIITIILRLNFTCLNANLGSIAQSLCKTHLSTIACIVLYNFWSDKHNISLYLLFSTENHLLITLLYFYVLRVNELICLLVVITWIWRCFVYLYKYSFCC